MDKQKLAFSKWEGTGNDFILVDAGHKIRYVTQDLRWTRLLAPGGRVCFHDYAPRCPGVMKAVDHFLSDRGNYRREALAGSLLVLEKTAASPVPEVDWTDHLWAGLWAPWLQWQASWRKRLA